MFIALAGSHCTKRSPCIWQDLNNANLNKKNANTTSIAGSGAASASPKYKPHPTNNSGYNSTSNYSNDNSPSLVTNGNGAYSREVLINKTVDELPEGVDPTKKEVKQLLKHQLHVVSSLMWVFM